MKIFSLLVLLLLNTQVQAQKKVQVQSVDTLSISTLIDNFSKYKQKEASYNIDRYDYYVIHPRAKKEYFEVSPLNALKGMQVSDCRGEWFMDYENNKSHLYLTKIVSLKDSSKVYADKLYLSLKNKYGEVTSKGIPARWVNGKYSVLYCPMNLFGEIVSQSLLTLDFWNGIQTSRAIGSCRGTIEESRMENGKIRVRLDGCWYDDLSLFMRYLSEFVNEHRSVQSDSNVEQKFSLLLFTDLNGKSQMICLDKKKVINANREILDDLKKCIAQLPVGSFGYMKTLQGKTFQGRYLIGAYSGNLGWHFTDYIDHP